MSITTEIARIEGAKTDIATAITGKGGTVPEGTKLDGMSALIAAIPTGAVIREKQEQVAVNLAASSTTSVVSSIDEGSTLIGVIINEWGTVPSSTNPFVFVSAAVSSNGQVTLTFNNHKASSISLSSLVYTIKYY